METNELSKKWLPVLAKCPEIPRGDTNAFAQLLENQLASLSDKRQKDRNLESIQMFTRVALPMVRKMWTLLTAKGIEIIPLSDPEMGVGVREDRINSIPDDYLEAEKGFDMEAYARRIIGENEPINGIDRDEAVCGTLAKECVENIVALFGGEKVIYNPYILFKYDGETLTAIHTWTPIDE